VAKFKDLLISTRIVEAGRKRKCYHSPKHAIHKGDLCFEVKEGLAWKGYCLPCAEGMLNQAEADLQNVRKALAAGSVS
jgi:hypothetical protein